MLRKWLPAMAMAALVTAACGDTQPGDDVIQRDTTIMTVPDTIMVERTITEDTIRDPDLHRDTLHRDTLPGDTM
jgi:hypothetical protein